MRASLVLYVYVCAFIGKINSIVVVNPISPVSLGDTVVLTCNLTGELQNQFSWYQNFNGTSIQCNLATIITNNCQSRYTIAQTTFNSTHLLFSTLTINNVTSRDFSTSFECRVQSVGSANLNLTLFTTTTRFTTTTPFEPCFGSNHNASAYVLIIISNIVVILALVYCYFFIKDPMTFQLLILYIAILISVILMVIMIVFWINPNYVNGDSNVWPTIVILPCGCGSLVVLWIAFLYFLVFSYTFEKIIELPILIISCILCLFHLILISTILSAISYCTAQTVFSVIAINYSVLTNIAAAIILFISLILAAMIFWKHKGNKSVIGIESAPMERIHDHTVYSGFHGIKSTNPSVNLSPTNFHANLRDIKSSLNAVNNNVTSIDKDKEKLIPKEKDKEVAKEVKAKEKDAKEKEKSNSNKKQDKSGKPEQSLVKSPETSFNSMDFDQNELRRSTPNPDDVDAVPKTTNPLLMNFIKNSNEQNNLEAIVEESQEPKRKTPKLSRKEKDKEKDKKESKDKKEKKEKKEKDDAPKDSSRSTKKEEKEKKSESNKKKGEKTPPGGNDSNDDFDMEPISESLQREEALDTQRAESDVKKVKKEGKGKTKPPKE